MAELTTPDPARAPDAACRPLWPTSHEGETVLDLGSGAGTDVLISARRVGTSGRAIGLDMTDEMLDLGRAHAAQADVDNCVINLAADKAEAARELRPGGRLAVSDVTADPDVDVATRADVAASTGCIAGALTEHEFRAALGAAGLTDVEIRSSHRVHDRAASAIVRARKPAG